MLFSKRLKGTIIVSFTLILISIPACIVEPDIPYDEYPIWVITSPGTVVHKLTRQLELTFAIQESGSGFTRVMAVNPDDKNVWFKTASGEITVFDENWHENYGPISLSGVSSIKINDTAQRVWIMAGDVLYIYSFTGVELGSFTVGGLDDFAPIEGDSGVWCLTSNGFYLSEYSDSGELLRQLTVSDFYSGNAAKLFYAPGDDALWISSDGAGDDFIKVDSEGTLLATVSATRAEVKALNRRNGDICYASGGDTAGIGLVDSEGVALWFTEVAGVSAATIGETDNTVLYIAETDGQDYLYRAVRSDGEITHFAGPYSADTILLAATGIVYGE